MVKIHLSRLLGEKRWTQKDLADATGIRPSTINEWYHELVPRLNVDHIDKICEAFQLPLWASFFCLSRLRQSRLCILRQNGFVICR